jgi:hypothetical protein
VLSVITPLLKTGAAENERTARLENSTPADASHLKGELSLLGLSAKFTAMLANDFFFEESGTAS